MTRRGTRRAYIFFALVMVLYFISCAVLLTDTFRGSRPNADLFFFALTLTFPIVGLVVATRRPENAVGWILLGIGLAWATGAATSAYATYALRHNPGSLPGGMYAAWMSGWAWAPPVGLMSTFLILLFPTGRLLSRRWRIVGWLSAFAIVGTCFAIQFSPTGDLEEFGFKGVENPFNIPALRGVFELLQLCVPLMAVCFVASAASLVIRFRRSRGVERVQMKWLTTTVALLAAMFALSQVLSLGRWGETTEQPAWQTVLDQIGSLMFFLIPISIGIAIVRHRLFDIDVVINKALVYGALAAFITAIYVGIVVGVGALIGSGDKPNLGLSLAATAVVAVAFQPVRSRVQRLANRLVYGARLSPYEAVTEFSERISTSLSFEEVLPRMAEAAAKGVGGTRATVKMFLPGGSTEAAYFPLAQRDEDSFDKTVKVTHQGETVGEIAVAKAPGEQINDGEDKLLKDLASQAGLAMRNLRLTAELQQKLIELQESRKRIVEAQDQERRRMERDIHDGAQQQLVSMTIKSGLANNLLKNDPTKAVAMLDELSRDANETVETLRDLARGLFPQVLVDRGLGAAIAGHTSKTGANAVIEDELQGARFDLEIEASLYFCIREALQNASKHASGSPVTIRILESDGWVSFRVSDEGPGFDPSRVELGSGLQNMADRIEAIGGEFLVKSSPGKGATVEGRIPTTREEMRVAVASA